MSRSATQVRRLYRDRTKVGLREESAGIPVVGRAMFGCEAGGAAQLPLCTCGLAAPVLPP